MFSIEALSSKEIQRFRNSRGASLRDSPEAFKSTYNEMSLLPDTIWEEQLKNLPTFVALYDQKDVGVVRCAIDWDHPNAAHLYSLWVDPDYHGVGVGGLLVDTVIDWAKANRSKSVYLNVVEDNKAAISLYRKMGFKFTGVSQLIKGRNNLKELQMVYRLST